MTICKKQILKAPFSVTLYVYIFCTKRKLLQLISLHKDVLFTLDVVIPGHYVFIWCKTEF